MWNIGFILSFRKTKVAWLVFLPHPKLPEFLGTRHLALLFLAPLQSLGLVPQSSGMLTAEGARSEPEESQRAWTHHQTPGSQRQRCWDRAPTGRVTLVGLGAGLDGFCCSELQCCLASQTLATKLTGEAQNSVCLQCACAGASSGKPSGGKWSRYPK